MSKIQMSKFRLLFGLMIVCVSVFLVYCCFWRLIDLNDALSIEVDAKLADGNFSITIFNHSNYDIEIFYEQLYFPGVVCVSFNDGSISKFMDGRYLNILRTSTVEAKRVRILRNSGFTEKCNIKDLVLIDNYKSKLQRSGLSWVEVENLPVLINSRPNVQTLISAKSDKFSSESELGAVLQARLKK